MRLPATCDDLELLNTRRFPFTLLSRVPLVYWACVCLPFHSFTRTGPADNHSFSRQSFTESQIARANLVTIILV
jgi:hypothetical protein